MPSRIIHFEDLELDLGRYELRRYGRSVPLEKLPMELLILLVEKQGQLVSRAEIIEKLWGKDVFLDTEHGINNAIRKIRLALKDDADKPRFLEAVVGKGYRFIAPTDEVEVGHGAPKRAIQQSDASEGVGAGLVPALAQYGAGSPQQGHLQGLSPPAVKEIIGVRHGMPIPRRRVLGLRGTSLAALAAFVFSLNVRGWRERLLGRANPPPIQSLAVLPLENLSGDPAQEYFADGITDALITDLAKIGSLRVISRTSAMQYKGTKKALHQVARELHVDAVVEGTVVRSGKRVRIDAQLIQAATDRHLWANSYERD